MNFMEYIDSSLAKGSIGANISVGIFAFIGVLAILGIYHGVMRGFSKSVIRIFTVGASAVCSLFAVMGVSKLIVKYGIEQADSGSQSVDALINKYAPQLTESLPDMVKSILAQTDARTATIFAMMIIAVVLSPVLFISFFYIIRMLSIFVYNLLAGLTGAISYGKSIVSTILGGVVGLCQGVLIAAVVIAPISGLCTVAMEARDTLLTNSEKTNGYIETAYTKVIDDLADNPMFDIVDKFGGSAAYERMITVKIEGETMDMGEECIGAVRVLTDLLPVANPDFKWKTPTEEQKESLAQVVIDVGDDDLIAALAADVMRGIAISIQNDSLDMGLTGASELLVNDVMNMFATTNEDTVEGDLDLLVDIYFIMCDRHLIETFSDGSHHDIREMLTDKDENGKSSADVILARLREYDRAAPIVSSFTKISIAVMHGSTGFDEESEQLYESVKSDLTHALAHNKSDFETEEEYKEAVNADLDKALQNNNINIEEDVKQGMVDYIAENYGDFEGEITEKELNDAILSYYESYSKTKDTSTETPDEGTTDEGTTDEGTTDEGTTD